MLVTALTNRGYNQGNLRKLKRHIWYKYEVDRHQDQKAPIKEILPIITYYDNFHARLNKKWAQCIRANAIFDEVRVISAYRRHKNLKDLLVKGRFGNNINPPDDDSDTEALLDALIQVLERDNVATNNNVINTA